MKRLVVNGAVVHLAVVAAMLGAGCGNGNANHPPDAAVPDDAMPDVGSDGPGPGPMGGLRFLNASPLSDSSLDIYLHGQSTPLITAVPYRTTTAQVAVPVGSIVLDVRPAGAPAAMSPSYVSDPIAVTAGASILAIGAGLLATDATMPPPPATAFRIAAYADSFAAPAPGKARVRLVNAMYSLAAIAIDVGDDGTLDLGSLDRFAVSDAAGIEVAASSDLVLGAVSTDAVHTRVGSFVVPATALAAGTNVYVVISGLSTFPARTARGAIAIIAPPPGPELALYVRPEPVVYLLAASPDASLVDGYLGASKLFTGLAFGRLGASAMRSTTTGHMLDIRAAGAAPGTAPLASLSTGALDAGQQYLAVLTGLVSPVGAEDGLALRVYRDGIAVNNDFGRMRLINASVGAGVIDGGRYPTGGGAWVNVPDFAAIPPGGASPASGTPMDMSIVPAPLLLGARLSATPALALRFDTLSGLNAFDRAYGVLAGAWSPTRTQIPPRYIVVKTAAINPWSTTVLSAIPETVTITPPSASVTAGGTQQFAATAALGNGATQDVTTAAIWSSLDTQVAEMSTTTRGLASAEAPGATTISAKLGTVTGTAAITVTPSQALAVSSTNPGDGATGVAASAAVAITFNLPIAPATLIAQNTTGPCSGTLQLSADGFTTCVGLAAPVIDATGTIATAQPAAPLASQATYRLRVSSTVTTVDGVPMSADFTQTTGFRITCAGTLVISQIYGGGSAAGGVYRNDFIELHNSGGTPVDLTGYALQSGLPTGTSWTRQALPSAIIPPGGYFLIQEAGGTSMTQLELPTPDAAPAGPLSLNGVNGKVALSLAPAAFTVACPLTVTPPLPVTDLVGYGTGNCFEGTAATMALTNATAALRNGDGCTDTSANDTDLSVLAPTPRNSASPPHICACAN